MNKVPKVPATVESVFAQWPATARKKAMRIRKLVYHCAGSQTVQETLKWGEPSYLTKNGSTLRMGWKQTSPDNINLYFNCQSKLVDTFREVYQEQLEFEGNRAIVLGLSGTLPDETLKHCISLTLNYHRIKHLPLLGA